MQEQHALHVSQAFFATPQHSIMSVLLHITALSCLQLPYHVPRAPIHWGELVLNVQHVRLAIFALLHLVMCNAPPYHTAFQEPFNPPHVILACTPALDQPSVPYLVLQVVFVLEMALWCLVL